MNSSYFKHCNGIFVNNYLLTGNKMQLRFTEMNSWYFIFRVKWTIINWRVHRGEIKEELIFIFILPHFCSETIWARFRLKYLQDVVYPIYCSVFTSNCMQVWIRMCSNIQALTIILQETHIHGHTILWLGAVAFVVCIEFLYFTPYMDIMTSASFACFNEYICKHINKTNVLPWGVVTRLTGLCHKTKNFGHINP